jgi:hypothetical protein
MTMLIKTLAATATDFWADAGTLEEHLPQEIVMSTNDMVLISPRHCNKDGGFKFRSEHPPHLVT